MTRRGHFSATESEDKGSSTGTTPKESQRKLVFHHKNQTPPGHFSGASWEDHPHMDKATGKCWGKPGFLLKQRQISHSQISIQLGKFLGNFSPP